MDPLIVGSLISAGAKLIPDIANLFGSGSDRKAEAQFNANFELQQRLAEHGSLIRARDVMQAYKETGLHPLALLGMNPASASPVASMGFESGKGFGSGIAGAGQDIGRAVAATAGADERAASQKLLLERGQLENDLLRVRTAREAQALERDAQLGPAMPIGVNKSVVPGQGDATLPPHVEQAKAFPSIGYAKVADGGLAVIPSKQFQERTEDYSYMPLMWVVRELALPHAQARQYPPPASVEKLKEHHRWEFGVDGVWRQVYAENQYPDRHLPMTWSMVRRHWKGR